MNDGRGAPGPQDANRVRPHQGREGSRAPARRSGFTSPAV